MTSTDNTDITHDITHDNTLEPENVLTLFDKFLLIYNKKYNASGSMFENVDIKNPMSTNEKMELFYEYMIDHKELYDENPNNVDVYDPESKIENSNSYDIYALIIGQSSSIKYLSLSFISLLTIGCQKIESSIDWSIVKL
jgi:hypothetical protein